jgi:hypothetical protein
MPRGDDNAPLLARDHVARDKALVQCYRRYRRQQVPNLCPAAPDKDKDTPPFECHRLVVGCVQQAGGAYVHDPDKDDDDGTGGPQPAHVDDGVQGAGLDAEIAAGHGARHRRDRPQGREDGEGAQGYHQGVEGAQPEQVRHRQQQQQKERERMHRRPRGRGPRAHQSQPHARRRRGCLTRHSRQDESAAA